MLRPLLPLGGAHRQPGLTALLPGHAEIPGGTVPAQRYSRRQAHRGPQIHQRLIVGTGPLLRHGRRHPAAEGLAVFGIQYIQTAAGDPCRQTQHVAVHRRNGLSEGDGEDSPRRIVSDARKGRQLPVCLREASTVLFREDAGRLLQISGPAVIAQPLPQLHEPLRVGLGQGLHRGEGLHEPLKIRQHRRHTGLLEHDLRHPCSVGGYLFPPRQDAPVDIIPCQQRLGQLL